MELSKSVEFNVIMTIVNLISKTVYFVLTHTMVSIEEAARIFLHHV